MRPARVSGVTAMGGGSGVRMKGRAAVLLVVALAGCGGGGGDKDPAQSAADRRAELDRWVSRADGVCRKSNEAIAERGWPRTLVELDKAAARAVEDVRAASRAIQGLAPPKGSEERVKPFVASVRELDGLLDRVTETTDAYKPKRLNDLAVDLQTGLQEVEDTSKELGLRECAANDEHTWVPDAMRAPVYAQQLADVDRKLGKRAKAAAEPVTTPADAAGNLDRLSDIVFSAERLLRELKPPQWAVEQAGRYSMTLRDLTGVLDEGARVFDSDITFAEYRRYGAKLNRVLRVERRRYRQLYKAVGAIPTLRGGKRGGEAPAEDDSEAA